MLALNRPAGEGTPLASLEVSSRTIFYTKRAKHVLLGCKECFMIIDKLLNLSLLLSFLDCKVRVLILTSQNHYSNQLK